MSTAVSSSMPAQIDGLLEAELTAAHGSDDRALRATAADFEKTRCAPRSIEVNFSGGITQECWAVNESDGTYRVIYLPRAGYFALCVESVFGPLDIGVHGPALGCYGSV